MFKVLTFFFLVLGPINLSKGYTELSSDNTLCSKDIYLTKLLCPFMIILLKMKQMQGFMEQFALSIKKAKEIKYWKPQGIMLSERQPAGYK